MTQADIPEGQAAGYVTDVGYTFGYHAELNPLTTRLAFLRVGLAPPNVATACELGFGQGVSLAVHAAAGPARWWGCDLLPAHVRHARALDEAAGSGSVLVAADFAGFAARDDLPAFDFIGLNGVLSWISAENRAHIAAFLRDRLAPGGVVCTSHNTLAGWADLLPLRRLMTAHAAVGDSGDTVTRIEAALEFTGRLIDANPLALRTLPGVAGRFERLRHADRRYLAHEYFNRDWEPFAFGDAAALLAGAGLRHACAARLRDHLDGLNLTGEQRRLLADITDPVLRETARDLLTGIQVRRDYWVRDIAPLSSLALEAAWHDTRLVLVVASDVVPERVSGPLGDIDLTGPVHRAVLAALADRRPHRLGELQSRIAGTCTGLTTLAAAAFELAAVGGLAVAQDDATIAACTERSRRLNAALAAGTAGGDDPGVRASPVTGGGLPVRPARD